MQNKIEQKWCDDNHKEIMQWNELIGKFCQLLPELEYCVGNANEDSIRYSPKHIENYYPDPYSQRKECERFIKEQEEKKYVMSGVLEVKKYENWPLFHQDWNMIILGYEKIWELVGYNATIEHNHVIVDDITEGGPGLICIERLEEGITRKMMMYKCLVRFVEYYNRVNPKRKNPLTE